MLSTIQPIVLVGGRSQRFGRDKLREPVGLGGAEWLVDRPISALREVFGRRVGLVGDCHPSVAARGDLVLADPYPGSGPAGGILAALEQGSGDVFVLAGDLPNITARTVRVILDAVTSDYNPDTSPLVVVAQSDGIQPCIGLYRRAILPLLADRLRLGRRSLHDLAPPSRVQLVAVDARDVLNVNTPDAV
jgi:molybdopterin-guanine dinucleotide biosynthesis protein A